MAMGRFYEYLSSWQDKEVSAVLDKLLIHIVDIPVERQHLRQFIWQIRQHKRPDYAVFLKSKHGAIGKSFLFNLIRKATRGCDIGKITDLVNDVSRGYGRATIDGAHLIVVEECDGEVNITDLKGLITGTDMELGEKHEKRRTTILRFQLVMLSNNDQMRINDYGERRRLLASSAV